MDPPVLKKRKSSSQINSFDLPLKMHGGTNGWQTPVTPLDECLRYLQRNPIMRELIGALIRQEEEEDEEEEMDQEGNDDVHQEKKSRSPLLEQNPVIKECVDKFQTPRYTWEIHLQAQDFSSEYDNSFAEADVTIPDPPILPSYTSALQAITVHFASDDVNHCRGIKGVTLDYSDGLELLSRGFNRSECTSTTRLRLRPNEHVIAQETCYSIQFDRIRAVRFLTTSNRWLEAGNQPTDRLGYRFTRDSFKEGWVLHDLIEIFRDNGFGTLHFFHYLMPLANFDKVVAEPSIPTLQTLAYDAMNASFRNESQAIELNGNAVRRDMANEASYNMKKITSRYRQTFYDSPEVSFYRLISSLIPKAKARVDARLEKLLGLASKERVDLLFPARSSISASRRHCASQHAQAFIQQGHVLDECADLSSIPRNERELMCFAPDCRKAFHYGKVAAHKRCSVSNCSLQFPSCGCSIIECDACHKFVCKLHWARHKRFECTEEERRHASGDETSHTSWAETSYSSRDETHHTSGAETSHVSGDESSRASGDETRRFSEDLRDFSD